MATTGLDNFFVTCSFKNDRPVEIQGTTTTNTHSQDCDKPKSSLENLTVPLPQEKPLETSLHLATFEAICQRKMYYQ